MCLRKIQVQILTSRPSFVMDPYWFRKTRDQNWYGGFACTVAPTRAIVFSRFTSKSWYLSIHSPPSYIGKRKLDWISICPWLALGQNTFVIEYLLLSNSLKFGKTLTTPIWKGVWIGHNPFRMGGKNNCKYNVNEIKTRFCNSIPILPPAPYQTPNNPDRLDISLATESKWVVKHLTENVCSLHAL